MMGTSAFNEITWQFNIFYPHKDSRSLFSKFPSESLNPSRSVLKCFIIFTFTSYDILLYFVYFDLFPGIGILEFGAWWLWILSLLCCITCMFTVLYNLQDASPASWISAIYVIVLFTRLFLLYSSLHKKIGIQIFVYNSFVSVMQKWQLHFLFFSISIKNLKWKQHFYTDISFISWNYLLWNYLLLEPGSSNLNFSFSEAQQMVLC